MNIQKRYIYSALLTGGVFIIIYAILDFYLWISLLISVFVYIAGIFIFKSKDIRIYDEKALSRYNFDLSRLNAYKDQVKDKFIKEKIINIVDICQKLIKYLNTKPRNATPIYNSLDYYLKFAVDRVIEYMKVENIKEKSFTENKLLLKMNVYLKEIETECNNLYKEVLKSKDKQINYEMKKFELFNDIDEGSDKDA